MKKKITFILAVIIFSLSISPVYAKHVWNNDDLYDWFNIVTGEPSEGIDWLDIKKTSIHQRGDTLVLRIMVRAPIKAEERENWAAYWWDFDLDKNSETGLVLEHLSPLGYDAGIRVKYFYETESWTAVFFRYDIDGNQITKINLQDFHIQGTQVTVYLPYHLLENDNDFYWGSNSYDYEGGVLTGNYDIGMSSIFAEY